MSLPSGNNGPSGGGNPGGSLSLMMRVENSLMGMWHMMTESRTSTYFSRVLALALLLFDFLTTASLAVHEDSLLKPYLKVTIHDLLPSGDKVVFLCVYVIVQAVVWFALLDGAFVAWSFAIGRFRALWPAHVLRTIIGIVGTALYNPFLEVLVLPLRCSELAYYWTSTSVHFPSSSHRILQARGLGAADADRLSYDPSGLTCPPGASFTELSVVQIIMTCLSLLAMFLFVPFALSTQLVYIDADPATEAWDGMSNGRENVVDSAVRTALVFLTFFVKTLDPVAHAAVFVVLLAPLTHRLIVTLPFYRPWHNMLRAGLYGITTWLAVEALALSCMRKYNAANEVVLNSAVGFVASLPFIAITIALLPLLRYQQLRRGLVRVLHAIDAMDRDRELAEARKSGDRDTERLVLAEDLEPAAILPAVGGALVRTMSRVFQFAGLSAMYSSQSSKIKTAGDSAHGPPSSISFSHAIAAPTDGSDAEMMHGTGMTQRSTRRLAAVMADKSGDELICVMGAKTRDTAEAAARFNGHSESVEAMAILVLQTNWSPLHVDGHQHLKNLELGLFTRRAISQAERVFEHGVLAFPADPGVRVAYARFLSTFAQDSVRAIGMLQTVNKCAPRLEDRFALFSFGRSLDQKRQSSDLGEGELDAVGIIAFRQTQSQALRHHSSSVANILQLWKMIDGKQSSIGTQARIAGDSQSGTRRNASGVTAAQLTEQIAKIVASRSRAQGDYDKLLARYPNAVLLLRSYQSFVSDVLNDPGWAAAIASRIEGLLAGESKDEEGPNGTGDKKSTYQGTVRTRHTEGSDGDRSGASWNRKSNGALDQRMGNQGSRSVADMRWKMQAGLVLLAILASIIFAVTRTTLDDFSRLIGVIFDAGSRRYQIVAGGFYTRTLVLAAGVIHKSGYDTSVMCSPTVSCLDNFNDARTRTLEAMAKMQSINSRLYDPSDSVKLFPSVRMLYDAEDRYTCNQVSLGPPAVNMSIKYGLQALLVKYAGNCVAAAQIPVARLAQCANYYCDDPVIWRFIHDSWYVALTGANEASDEYVRHAFNLSEQFRGISFGLLGVVACVLLFLWSCVFWPAAMSVQRTNAGVVSIADCIPREAVRVLVKRYTRVEQQLGTLSEQVSGDVNGKGEDVESDRGLGSEDSASSGPEQDDRDEEEREWESDIAETLTGVEGSSRQGNIKRPHGVRRPFHIDGPSGTSVNDESVSGSTRGRKTKRVQGSRVIEAQEKSGSRRIGSEQERTDFSSTRATPARVDKGRINGISEDYGGEERGKGNEDKENGHDHDSVGSAAVEAIDDGHGAQMDEDGQMRLDKHTAPSHSSHLALRSPGIPPIHPSTVHAHAQAHALDSVPEHAEVLLPGAVNPQEEEHLSRGTPRSAMRNTLAASSSRAAMGASGLLRGVSFHADAQQVATGDSHERGIASARTSSSRTFGKTSTGAGKADFEELKRAGASAQNVLDQMISDQSDFKYQLALASNLSPVRQGHGMREHGPDLPLPSPMPLPAAVLEASAVHPSPRVSGIPAQSAQKSRQTSGPENGARRSSLSSGAGKSRRVVGTVDAVVVSTSAAAGDSEAVGVTFAPPMTAAPTPWRDEDDRSWINLASVWHNRLKRAASIIGDTISSFGVVLGVGKSNISLSPLLRTLSSRVGLALVVLLFLQSLAAGLNYESVQTASYTASAINVAGYRRELAITTAFQARELLVGPDIIGTYALAVDLMRDYTDALSRYHRALLLGDAALKLRPTRGTDPDQDTLLANPDGSAFDQLPFSATSFQLTSTSGKSNITEEQLLTANVARMGLDYLVTRYVDASNSFLARYEPWLTTATPERIAIVKARYGLDLTVSQQEEMAYVNPEDGVDYRKSVRHNLTKLMEDSALRELEIMAFKLLDSKLETSVSLYLAQVDRQAATSTIIQITVFALNIAILVALQYGVFATQFANLAAEAQRTQELLRLIPGPVLDTTPKLKAFLSAGSKGA